MTVIVPASSGALLSGAELGTEAPAFGALAELPEAELLEAEPPPAELPEVELQETELPLLQPAKHITAIAAESKSERIFFIKGTCLSLLQFENQYQTIQFVYTQFHTESALTPSSPRKSGISFRQKLPEQA